MLAELDWAAFGMKALDALLPIVTVVMTALASWAASRLAKKWGVEYSAKMDEQVRAAARFAVSAANEWRIQRWKATGRRPTGNEVADRALEILKTLLDSQAVKAFGDDGLKGILDAGVNMDRAQPDALPPLRLPADLGMVNMPLLSRPPCASTNT